MQPDIELNEVWFRYEKTGKDIIKGLSFKAYPREISAILGGNGTGKSTALSLISGVNTPYRGSVKIKGRLVRDYKDKLFEGLLGVVPQNPQELFVKKTIREDLKEMLRGRGLTKEQLDRRVTEAASLCSITDIIDRHPYDISGGEQQRAAIAKILLLQPKILLMDEPTKGLDGYLKQCLAAILKKLAGQGVTIVLVSHDIEFCAEYADECSMLYDGQIVAQDSPQSFFSGNSFYTTAANRMCRQFLPDAVTPKQVVEACGGENKESIALNGKLLDMTHREYCQETQKEDKSLQMTEDGHEQLDKSSVSLSATEHTQKKKLTKRTIAAAIMILFAIPCTILFGVYRLGDRKYLFISLLVMLETMVPFIMVFEDRKPQARELVIISVLSAIAVAGRAAFYMLPQFKPVAAIVIISGVAFGGEAGFLVGAASMLVSNMLFSQGTWTPWQMFAMGIIGFIAGILFRKGLLRRNRVSLCTFGIITVLLVYGGIMNPASVIMFQSHITWKMLLASYTSGFPMDMVHAAGTAVFLWFMSKPMLEKLDRIKTKYGMIE